jgi:hypothetical protein
LLDFRVKNPGKQLADFSRMRDPLLAAKDLNDLPVYDAADVPIGATFGVLCEADTGLVRYFDIAIDGRPRHVLVPVGHARMDKLRGRFRLRLRAATVAELERIPAYEPHADWTEDEFQDELLTAFGRLFQGERYYAHPAFDHTGLYAGAHPLLRDPLTPVSPSGLRRLSAAPDFKIRDGEPDIRGWTLFGDGREPLGRIIDLIIDTDAQEVRYVVVQRDADAVYTALPVGYLELGDECVRAPLSARELAALPPATGDTFERADEAKLRAVLDSLLSGSRRYARPDFRSAA